MKIKISEITIHEGRRDVDNVKVSELAESIKVVGLINPITVGKDNTLIAGAHRLEACRQLGFDKIECVLLDCDELLAELAEIDENFIRCELDDIAIGELANRRDEILDSLGVRAKQGQGRPQKNGADSAPLKTTADIAKEMGTSERALQVNKQLARDLVPEAKEAVRIKALPKSAALEISRFEPEQQREIVAQKNKKAIIEGVRRKKGKSKTASSPRKTVAKEQEPDEDFMEQYMDWLNDPVNYKMPSLEQNEENVLKLPLPLDHKSMLPAFRDVFGQKNEAIRNRVIAEVKNLADIIDNLND
jgi:ParB family chromosome partitioning protein